MSQPSLLVKKHFEVGEEDSEQDSKNSEENLRENFEDIDAV